MGGEPNSAYSLAGIRAATTRPQQDLVLRVVEALEPDPRILAGYLVGGFAVGQADPFSDVDLRFLVEETAAEELRGSWIELFESIAAPVAVPFRFGIGGSLITADWLHYDVVFHPVGSLTVESIEGMVPLFDKAALLPPEAVPRPDRRGEPFFPEAAVQQFLYMLGNMVSVVGRNEPIPLTNGVVLVRDLWLVRLLLAEQGLESTREQAWLFPFTKRLRSYLTDEQNELLEGLPSLAPTIDSGIEGYVALARVFLPRAKALAARTGATWPSAFEDASVSYFERMLGARIDPS